MSYYSDKKDIFIIGFTPNPRLIKRMKNESTIFDVKAIYWNRGSEMIDNNGLSGIPFTEIIIKAKNNPLKRIIPYLKFRKKAYAYIKKESPDFIHVQGLDMLSIAIKYQKKHKVKIIYETADLHRFIIDEQRNPIYKLLQKILISKEKQYCNKIDLLILTSKMYYSTYYYKIVPRDKYIYMPNIPNLECFYKFERKEYNPFDIYIGFVGIIRYKKQIRLLLEAAKATRVKLVFAGYETNGNDIEVFCRDNGHIWLGAFDYEQDISKIYSMCDAIFSVYDADMNNCRVALPNKLYESIYCEIPIIVAKKTYLADVVNELGIGIAVSHHELNDFIYAIESLRNPSEYYKMVDNCKKNKTIIDLEKYNRLLNERIEAIIDSN